MPARFVRRGLWTLGIAALALALALVALPYFAANRIVRDRIAQEIGAWSGYRVILGAPPEIEFWPSFRAILSDVTLSTWISAAGKPVLTAERVEIELSALAVLSGDIGFSTAKLIRPTLTVEPSASGLYLPVQPGGGRIAQSIDLARGIVAKNADAPDLSQLPKDAFGIVAFEDGRIVTTGMAGELELVTGLTGKASWSALDRAATVTAAGVWRGEAVSVDVAATKPLLLLGGGASPVTAVLKSAPANLVLDGTASLMREASFDGHLTFSSPSLRRMLEWSHAGLATGSAIGSVAIEGHVAGNASRIKVEDASVTLDGSPGQGRLDLMMTGKLPTVSGTLAFDTLDLLSLQAAFTPLQPSVTAGPGAIDASLADRVNLDLRLSSARATVGSVALTDVAATAQVNEGFAAFDISDASAFGGTLQAGLHFDRKTTVPQVEIRLLASDVDGGALAGAAGMTRLVPVGKGTVSVILKGPGSSWDTILEKATGSVSANFGAGSLSGFDLDAFLKRTGEGGFFALGEVANGALKTDAITLRARVADGVATIEDAEAKSARATIRLTGVVPYVGRGLALTGWIEPAGQAPQPTGTNAASFFVGGSWSAPFISPVPRGPVE